jgi:hypothetical protein
LADYLEIRQAGDSDQASAELDKNVVVQVEYEIDALVKSSRVAAHLWHFLNVATANLIQSHLCQQESEADVISVGAIEEGDL